VDRTPHHRQQGRHPQAQREVLPRRNKRGVQASSGTHPDERRLAAPFRSYNSNDNGRWYLRFFLLDLNVVLAMPTVEVALDVAMHAPELRNTKRLGSSTASRSAQRRAGNTGTGSTHFDITAALSLARRVTLRPQSRLALLCLGTGLGLVVGLVALCVALHSHCLARAAVPRRERAKWLRASNLRGG